MAWHHDRFGGAVYNEEQDMPARVGLPKAARTEEPFMCYAVTTSRHPF